MSKNMNEGSDIDYEGLAAYISGECSAEEEKYWERWIGESESNLQAYLDCHKVLVGDQSLSNTPGNTFDSYKAWPRIKSRLEPSTIDINRPRYTYGWLKYAAVFLIGAFLITFIIRENINQTLTFNQDSGIQSYYLPDSSKVILKGKASITYPKDFSSRNLELSGTGYFDVRNMENVPFIVNSRNTFIRVLGTAFLVEENENIIQVTVDHGKVEIGLIDAPGQAIISSNEIGKIILAEKNIITTTVENTNELFWATRQLTYRQTPLPVVLDQLGLLFNMKIDYNQEMLTKCKLSAVFRDQDFEQILENIALSFNMTYEIKPDEVIIENATCN
jgi:ferric-dicitrate binding protein FerR (iron transport regulator)